MGLQELDAIVPLPQKHWGTETRVAENLAGGSCNPGRRRGGAQGRARPPGASKRHSAQEELLGNSQALPRGPGEGGSDSSLSSG